MNIKYAERMTIFIDNLGRNLLSDNFTKKAVHFEFSILQFSNTSIGTLIRLVIDWKLEIEN